MYENKFTPGPWVWNGAAAVYRDNQIIASAKGSQTGWTVNGSPCPTIEERNANAALIAAAPETVQSVEQAIEILVEAQGEYSGVEVPYIPEWMMPLREAQDVLESALRKARGDQ